MMNTQIKILSKTHRKQHGAALVIGLILLSVVTTLSLSSIRNTNLDAKIAANHQHKQISFQAAESALAKLTAGEPERSDYGASLKIPQTIKKPVDSANPTGPQEYKSVNNANYYQATGVDGQPDSSADLSLVFTEQSRPGRYKFSGFGLSVVTLIYQSDARGEVNNSNAKTHNRMQVALIRD